MKNTTKNFEMVVKEKKATIELVEALMTTLSDKEKWQVCELVELGEVQATDWNNRPLFLDEDGKRTTEDTGNPYMVQKTEYRLPANMDADQEATYNAINHLREVLADLV